MRTLLLPILLALLPAAAPAQVFDAHVHLWHGDKSLAEYRAQVKAAGLDPEIGAMWFGGPNHAVAGQIEATRASNDALIALAAKHRGVMPIATVHPYDGEAAIAELRRVAARGVKVLKIHAHTQKFDPADPRVLALAKAAGESGVIVLTDNAHIVPGDSEKLFDLALKAPKTTFVFAHMGGFNFRFWNILAAARTADGLFANNIHFDLSGMLPLIAGSPIEAEWLWTIRNVGIDQVMLGSDYPQFTLPQALAALDKLPLGEADKAKIRYGNARRLFGLAQAAASSGASRP